MHTGLFLTLQSNFRGIYVDEDEWTRRKTEQTAYTSPSDENGPLFREKDVPDHTSAIDLIYSRRTSSVHPTHLGISTLSHFRRTQCPNGHDGGRGRSAQSAVDAEPGHAGRDDAALAPGGGRPDADAGRPHQRRDLTV